jgi:iron complex transport system substrate-binding protein
MATRGGPEPLRRSRAGSAPVLLLLARLRPVLLALLTLSTLLGVLLGLAQAHAQPAAKGTTASPPPQRIVSLLPSLTETVCALGACDRLVGVDRHSNWPASVKALPSLGGLDDTQLERIVALKPDLVLASNSLRVVPRLRALGLRVEALPSDTRADLQRSIDSIAAWLGDAAAGPALWASLSAELAAAAAQVPATMRGRSVYFEVASTPYVAGEASFIGHTLADLGLRNIAPPSMGPFPQLNPEFVLRSQPQLLMLSAREAPLLAQRPGWAALPALQQQQVCAFSEAQFELLVRPGPRLAQAAQAVVACLQGLDGRRGARTGTAATPAASGASSPLR